MAHFRYIGEENADTRFHDGALRPIIGAQNVQVMRANREHPEQSQGLSFTYNHAPMLCRWQKKLYLMYLTSPVHEHDGLSRVMLTESGNGFSWAAPRLLFPACLFIDPQHENFAQAAILKNPARHPAHAPA